MRLVQDPRGGSACLWEGYIDHNQATCLEGFTANEICHIPDPLSVEKCVNGACSIKESLGEPWPILSLCFDRSPRQATRRFLDETCDIRQRNSSLSLLIVSWLFIALAVISTGTRLYMRRRLSAALNVRDYLVFIACVSSLLQR